MKQKTEKAGLVSDRGFWKRKYQALRHYGQKMHIKILLLCLSCTLLALVLQTVLFQRASSELIYRQSKEEIENSLQNLQDDLYSFIKTIENGMIDIYKQNDFITDMKNQIELKTLRSDYYRLAFNMATESFDSANGVVALYLYNNNHEIISTYRRAVTPKHNYPTDIYIDSTSFNADLVKKYVESEEAVTFISSYYNQYREKNIMRFVLKIYNNSNRAQKLGYIVCDVDTKVIQYLMEKYYVNEEAFIWLQPEGDQPVFEMGSLETEDGSRFELLKRRIEQRNMDENQLFADSNRVFFQIQQKKYNLTAYALMPQSLLEENQKTLNRNLLLIAGIMILLAMVFSIFISKTLTRPLENMTETARKIKEGDTRLRIQNCKEDEIGELGKSFNEMLDQIQTLIGREYEAKLLLNQAQYHALQAQINPHFLYNTLDTMSSIADIKGCPEVSVLCQSLSNIFRYSLDMKNPFSTVAGEIVHLKNYIYVMNVRMQEEVEYVFEIEDSILKSTMPKLSIQPLVENALTHGLRGSRRKKKIIVKAGKVGEDLLISVEDNGIGIPEEERRELLRSSEGETVTAISGDQESRGVLKKEREHHRTSIGLNNINSRMKMMYGEAYGLVIESWPGEGTRVSLQIPSIRMEEIELWKKTNTKF